MQADRLSVVERERLALRILCGGEPRGEARENARRLLRGYSWREPVHQAIFEALDSIPSDSPQEIRSLLPARLTLRGFPDVDFEDLFRPASLSNQEAERLLRDLTGSTGP